MLCPGDRINSSERLLCNVCFLSMDVEGKGGQWKVINEIISLNKRLVLSYSLSFSVTIWLTLEHAGALGQLRHWILVRWALRVVQGWMCVLNLRQIFSFQTLHQHLGAVECLSISRLSLDTGNTQPCCQCLFSAWRVGILCQQQLSGARIEGATWAWVPEGSLQGMHKHH